MILEGIVTTVNPDGTPNIAPMGPSVGVSMDRFLLRPFRTSTTFANLRANREGVFHVTDDVLLFARSAIGDPPDVALRPASAVRGFVLAGCCRYHEFRVLDLDESAERVGVSVETVREGRIRDWFGFNRARHAVLEAAILATRAEWLPPEPLLADFARFDEIVRKTGGPDEAEALRLLSNHLRLALARRGSSWDHPH